MGMWDLECNGDSLQVAHGRNYMNIATALDYMCIIGSFYGQEGSCCTILSGIWPHNAKSPSRANKFGNRC